MEKEGANRGRPARKSELNKSKKQRGPSMRALFLCFAASLGERIRLQPVRSRLAPQERCAQLSCASKPGGFMQPSGAQGAHKLLVRPGDARRKRKEEKSEAGRIWRILSALTCGFLGRPLGLPVSCVVGRQVATLAAAIECANAAYLPPHSKKNGPPDLRGGPENKSGENYLMKRVSRS